MGKHLIPKAYLWQFTTVGSGRVYVFDLAQSEWRKGGAPLHLERVAQSPKPWSSDDERELACLEGHGWTALERLCGERDIELSPYERFAAACYVVSMLSFRSHGVWTQFKSVAFELLDDIANVDGVADERERTRIEDWCKTERRNINRDRGHFRGKIARSLSVRGVNCIVAMRWTVLCAENGEFITSDTPAGKSALHLDLRGGRAWMPLSYKRLLLLDWASDKRALREEGVLRWRTCREVSRYNHLVVDGASRELYCRQPYPWVKRYATGGIRHREPRPSRRMRERVECSECGYSVAECGCSLGLSRTPPSASMTVQWPAGEGHRVSREGH